MDLERKWGDRRERWEGRVGMCCMREQRKRKEKHYLSSLACLGKHELGNPRIAFSGWSPLGQDPHSAPVLVIPVGRGFGSEVTVLAGFLQLYLCQLLGNSERPNYLFQSKQDSRALHQDKSL